MGLQMTEQERGLAENVNLYWLIVIKTESLYENGSRKCFHF